MGKNVRNFRGYNNQSNQNNTKNNFGGDQRGNRGANQKNVEQDVKNQFNKYSGYSENQLIDEFYKEVYKQKQMGNLSPAMLENFYNMMSPNMTPEQRKKMKSLIDSVK